MLVAVRRIGEPDRPVAGDDHIIHRVKRPAVEIRQQRGDIVRMARGHAIQATGQFVGALRTEHNALVGVLRVYPAIAHGDVGRGQLGDGRANDAIVLLVQGDFGDLHATGVVVGVDEVVAGDEESVVGGYEDAGFVGEGVVGVFMKQVQRRFRAKDGLESAVVDEEGLHVGCIQAVYTPGILRSREGNLQDF